MAVRELDTNGVLDAVVQRRRAADRAEAELLALAVHWVELHPVTEQCPAASFTSQFRFQVDGEQCEWPLAGLWIR